jgi:hypothetical protein
MTVMNASGPVDAATASAPVDIDLDALRKAKADGNRTKSFRLDGEVYSVASKLPAYVGILLAAGDPKAALRLWLGDEQEAKFSQTDVTQDEIQELIKDLYSVSSGESEGSQEPSSSTAAN